MPQYRITVMLPLFLIKRQAMKGYRGVELQCYAFLTSALNGGDWTASCTGRFSPGDRYNGNHWIGGWVVPRAGIDRYGGCGEEKNALPLTEIETRFLGPSARCPVAILTTT
jgi:hypothetical protein